MKEFDVICGMVEMADSWHYIEHESKTNIRFDKGDTSLWISFDEELGISAEGVIPNHIKKILVKSNVNLYE